MRSAAPAAQGRARALAAALGDEGLRLFFPLAAVHAALWPVLWVLVHRFDLPLARSLPPGVWHAHEMIYGTLGAALIGFITTAVPEWTETPRPRGRTLFALAAAWGVARVVGLLGADALALLAGIADLAWLTGLLGIVARASLRKPGARLAGFLFWLAALLLAQLVACHAFLNADAELARAAIRHAGLSFLGLLGLALARITPPVTNRVLDPSEATAPFRPHPGRRNLASGLIAVALAGELIGLSETATGYLLVAAGAGLLDRSGEAFVGRAIFRAEIIALAGSSALAGSGLLMVGAARIGLLPLETAGWHLALMGGLGLATMAVFAIAGLLHTGRPLGFAWPAKAAMILLLAATALRILPELGVLPVPPGPTYALASLAWAGAFLVWLKGYWPLLSAPVEHPSCRR
jgi:uncharacterized protein involved in response to NO